MYNFVVLDLETTGLSPASNEIIEIGAWKIVDGVVVSKFCTLVKPVCYISGEISRLTGITNEMVADACTIDEVIHEFYAFCGDLPFLGYNIQFDYGFLCEKGRRAGLDFTLNGQRQGIDVMKLAKRFIKSIPNYSLTSVAEYFHISLSPNDGTRGFHRAGYDAYMTKLIYDRFLFVHNTVPGALVPELLTKDTTMYGKAVAHESLSFE